MTGFILLSLSIVVLAVTWGLYALLSRWLDETYNQVRPQLEWVIAFILLWSFLHIYTTGCPEWSSHLSPGMAGLTLTLLLLVLLGAWWINNRR